LIGTERNAHPNCESQRKKKKKIVTHKCS